MKSLIKLARFLTVVAAAASVTSALAANLTLIPTLSGDTTNQARAVSPDGLYVVGLSGSPTSARGFLYQVGSASAINVLSSDGAQSTIATGVGYRTYLGQQQLIVSGLTSSGNTEWMTTDGGTSWAVKRRDTNLGTSPWTIAAANKYGGGFGGSDVFFTAFRDNANYWRVGKAWGAWPPSSNTTTLIIDAKSIPTGESANINGLSGTGRAVGRRGGRNYVMDWTGGGSGSVWFFNGLSGTQTGQVFSVSADGTALFGQSPITVGGTVNYGYKAVVTSSTPGTLLSINALPLFGDETGSTSLQVPYGCSLDGTLAVGMDYRGLEKAVLWNTSDPNPANWTVTDLTDFATALGILDGWTRLTRAYSIGIDAGGYPVITGIGVYGGATRGFVLTFVPEPTSGALLALGVFLLALRRGK